MRAPSNPARVHLQLGRYSRTVTIDERLAAHAPVSRQRARGNERTFRTARTGSSAMAAARWHWPLADTAEGCNGVPLLSARHYDGLNGGRPVLAGP